MRLAWTILVIAAAATGAVWSFRAHARFAGRFLRTSRFAWTQTPGALWVALCAWSLLLFFGLSATDVLFHVPSLPPPDGATQLDAFLRVYSFLLLFYAATLAVPCVLGAIVQLVRDRFRDAWRPLVLVVVPPVSWVGTWALLFFFAPAVRVTD